MRKEKLAPEERRRITWSFNERLLAWMASRGTDVVGCVERGGGWWIKNGSTWRSGSTGDERSAKAAVEKALAEREDKNDG